MLVLLIIHKLALLCTVSLAIILGWRLSGQWPEDD